MSKICLAFLAVIVAVMGSWGQEVVPGHVMETVYREVSAPYKYGLVLVPQNSSEMTDSPSIFRKGRHWYMIYIVFDGKGYETWLAKSNDLLHWEVQGKIMSFTENTWDANQKAGYIALQDYRWEGSYRVKKFRGKYWMIYLGGASRGYEAGRLGVGVAHSDCHTCVQEWTRLPHPVLSPADPDARWYDEQTIYKSSVIRDRKKTLGYPFIMFYNAKGSDKQSGKATAERIAMAGSDDMVTWTRYGNEPVIDHETGISGDAFITRMGDLWVMFYFGAFWKPGAFDRFACSYDLKNWTRWTGSDLISPGEDYDSQYAHKPFVIKYKGVVYHFYCAVDQQGNRGIALATSVDLGVSSLKFSK